MSDFSRSTTTSYQNSQGTKRKWVPEDVALVAYMVDFHNVGTRRYRIQGVTAKDRATKKFFQTTTDIVAKIDAKDVATTKNPEEGSNDYRCEVDVSLDEMDVSATQSQSSKPDQDNSTFSKKKKDF
ncbi:hypothetical protein Gotur_011620 [Gossypium turneri]